MSLAPPPAQDHAMVTQCPDCKVNFGLFVWKHMCRACGYWFCDDCTPGRRTIPKFGYNSPERVCNLCFLALAVESKDKATITQMNNIPLLRKFAAIKGIDLTGCVEKNEVVRTIIEETEKARLLRSQSRSTNQPPQPGQFPYPAAYPYPSPQNFPPHLRTGPPGPVPNPVPYPSFSPNPPIPSVPNMQPFPNMPPFPATAPIPPPFVPPVSSFVPNSAQPYPAAYPYPTNSTVPPPAPPSPRNNQVPVMSPYGSIPVSAPKPAIPEPRFDGLQSLRVSELRQVLERHNVSHDDCLEKEELIAKIIFIESTQPGEKEKKKSEKKLKKETKKKVFLRGVIGRHESHDDCLEKQVLIAKIIFIETKPVYSPPQTTQTTQTTETPTGEPPNEENLCIICMDAEIETVFLECGHMACCRDCGKACVDCPLCRRPISRVVNVFHAKK